MPIQEGERVREGGKVKNSLMDSLHKNGLGFTNRVWSSPEYETRKFNLFLTLESISYWAIFDPIKIIKMFQS